MKLTTAREGALETAKETFNEETKSKAVVLACEHSRLDAVADLSTETMPISIDVTVSSGDADLKIQIGRCNVDH